MAEFGQIREYTDRPKVLVLAKKVGILGVLDSDGTPTGEELEFDGNGGHVAYYDPDDENIELINGRMSEAFLQADLTPDAPEPGVEIVFERTSTERGQIVLRWALASFWRAQSERIGKPPFSEDDDDMY